MTSNRFSKSTVFQGLDAYGCRLALPWQPVATSNSEKAGVAVRFRVRDKPPYQFSTLQAAVDHVVSQGPVQGGSKSVVIEVGPGFFEGPVIIPPGAPAMILRGNGAERTVLAAPIDAKMTGLEYAKRFKTTIAKAGAQSKAVFAKIVARSHIGTGNTAVLRVMSDDVKVTGMTIRNDYACDRPAATAQDEIADAEGRYARGQHQAVAMMLDGVDRTIVSGCTLSSFQDTLYLRGTRAKPCRSWFTKCHIEGDVDFIFGDATALFKHSTIESRGIRATRSWVMAPSTPINQAFGFVFDSCNFTHDGAVGARSGRSFLGRQWFEGVRATPYGTPTIKGYSCQLSDMNRFDPPDGFISRNTLKAVGKSTVINSTLGNHLRRERLWDDWASGEWSPRFRPVQMGGADFMRYLEGWLPEQKSICKSQFSTQIWLRTEDCHY